jgi:3-oxoadipate enol-lactonase
MEWNKRVSPRGVYSGDRVSIGWKEGVGLVGARGDFVAFADLQGVRLHYEFSGDPALPVLVFSHALGLDLELWTPQLEALEPHFRVLRFDARGHGKSSTPSGPYSIEQFGGDVLELLNVLQIDRATFCGISMGGLIGQWLALYAPTRVERLILVSTAAKIGTADGWNERISTVHDSGLATVIPGALERWFTAGFRREHPEALNKIRKMLETTDGHGYAASCVAIRDADFRESIGSIRTPTLVVAGTHDPSTTPEDGRGLAAQIQGGSFAELSGAHLCSIEAAADFNTVLLEFAGA